MPMARVELTLRECFRLKKVPEPLGNHRHMLPERIELTVSLYKNGGQTTGESE